MKSIHLVGLFALLSVSSAYSYRFICNGLLANGEERGDECGVCDTNNAARWDDPNLSLVVDDTTLPKGIKKSEWQIAVDQSFAAWQSISGSSLRFSRTDGVNLRQFGANDSLHEIFWITDKQEWRKLVGSGEFGTLGATLPRYSCNSGGGKRSIFDADLVLNGMSHINWKIDCHDSDCISVQTTLVHELGHFFGLDHPCMMCSTSIMSARAGFDLMYPALDDIEGLRTLYPNGDVGGFASPCTGDGDCSSENRCINSSSTPYCSKDCRSDEECSLGAVCNSHEGSKVCSLSSTESATEKKEGENCANSPCLEPMICAGASQPNFYCYQPCKKDDNCKSNQECISLPDDLSVCVTIKNKGEACDHRDLCQGHLYCVFDKLRSGFCRAPCAKNTSNAENRCPNGEVCEKLEGTEVCLPLEHNLSLDDTSDGFKDEKSSGRFGKDVKKSQNKGATFGCQSHYPNKDNDLWLMVLVILGFSVRAIRKGSHSLPN